MGSGSDAECRHSCRDEAVPQRSWLTGAARRSATRLGGKRPSWLQPQTEEADFPDENVMAHGSRQSLPRVEDAFRFLSTSGRSDAAPVSVPRRSRSNMNYCLGVSNSTMELMEEQNITDSALALSMVQEAANNEFLAGGDMTMGSIILLVDSDTR